MAKAEETNSNRRQKTKEKEKFEMGQDDKKQIKILEQQLKKLIGVNPPITRIGYYDFDEPLYSKKVVLRTSEETKRELIFNLPQFDPIFFSPKQVQCRYPKCSQIKERNPNHSSKTNKEDLYLCRNHQKEMIDLITQLCADKKINVNYNDVKDEDFDGYEFLIAWMEMAFQHFKKKASLVRPRPFLFHALFPSSMHMVDLLHAEIFLNVRNFLIITNVLLNPDHENRYNVLAPIFAMLPLLLERRESVENFLDLLRELIPIILGFFGIVYIWVPLSKQENPGAQTGAGVGIALGVIGIAVLFGTESSLRLMILGIVMGIFCWGLVGGGIFNLFEHNLNRRKANQHIPNTDTSENVFKCQANPDGDLSITSGDKRAE